MPTSSYDLVVLGDDLAGLVAAALCARRGMRTALVGFGERPLRYATGPHRLPIEPLVIPGRGGAIDRVFRELNLEHAVKRRLRDARVAVQLVGPDQRIDVSADGQTMARELGRELPTAAAEAMAAAWNQAAEIARGADAFLAGDVAFPGGGFWERREAARLADRAADAAAAWWQRTRDALDGSPALALLQLPAALGDVCVDPSPLAIARALDSWRVGAPGLRGDLEGLVELLVERVTGASGERRAGRATEVTLGWNKVTSVLSDGAEVGVGQVIAGVPLAELAELVARAAGDNRGKKASQRLLEGGAELALAGWRYVLNLVVDESGIPEGMAPTVLAVVDPARPLQGDNAFSIHLGEPDDHGRVTVTVGAILPAAPGEPATAALRAGLLANLEMVMPFLGQHTVLVHSPLEADAPIPMRPLWRAAAEHGAGLSALPCTTSLKNVVLASQQVVPQLGLEGTFVTGWSAAKIACALAGKKRDYLKDEVVSA